MTDAIMAQQQLDRCRARGQYIALVNGELCGLGPKLSAPENEHRY